MIRCLNTEIQVQIYSVFQRFSAGLSIIHKLRTSCTAADWQFNNHNLNTWPWFLVQYIFWMCQFCSLKSIRFVVMEMQSNGRRWGTQDWNKLWFNIEMKRFQMKRMEVEKWTGRNICDVREVFRLFVCLVFNANITTTSPSPCCAASNPKSSRNGRSVTVNNSY